MSNLIELTPHGAHVTMQPVESRRNGPLWYCIALAGVQVGVLVLCLILAVQPWFLEHDGYPLLKHGLGYSLRAGEDCEIVLYGDSTALTGLEPAYIQQKTGLRTCNFSELRPVHWFVSSYFPLDQYLARHPRPRFILSSWGAYEFHPELTPLVAYQAEGFQYGLLYAHNRRLWMGLLMHHPMWVVWFSIWVENRIIDDIRIRLEGNHAAEWAAEAPRDTRGGFWQDSAKPQTRCMPVPAMQNVIRAHQLSREETRAAISVFKARYSVGGTRVVVDVSPIADCASLGRQLIDADVGLADNQLQFWPVHYFNSTDVHFTPEGTRLYSDQAANQILSMMRQDSTANQEGR